MKNINEILKLIEEYRVHIGPMEEDDYGQAEWMLDGLVERFADPDKERVALFQEKHYKEFLQWTGFVQGMLYTKRMRTMDEISLDMYRVLYLKDVVHES